MANPNYQDRNSESKNIFVFTIQLIGSAILLMIFIAILYGVFTGSMDVLLWKLFDWLIDILKPILSIVLVLFGAVKLPLLLFAFIESLYTDYRNGREEINLWQNLSPTPMSSNQNFSQNPTPETKQAAPVSEVGEKKLVEMWVDDPEGTGGKKEIVERYSTRWKELIALQGREYEHKPFVKKSNKEIFMKGAIQDE